LVSHAHIDHCGNLPNQAPETLGRRLVEKRPEVRILNTICKLRAEVVVMNGFLRARRVSDEW